MKSQILPPKVPIGFKVIGFGHTPVGTPELHLIVNALGDHKFYKRENQWFDSEGCDVAEEEAELLEQTWLGECAKMGLTP